ncbi:hypothetical protein [Synechococcus sp. A15-24]|uniref:hypothetical protein n=1 Tax=Synechococcus sp. A15-24 TaxID=1050635 RepID=UPI001644192F|nr:hypothetical protein [Synechococcus sp. A15-24]QNJ29501.1 hemolysin-type calcium-binding repeat family protein [Synechococcus sp. A15-24]
MIDDNGLYYAQNANGSGTFDVLTPDGTHSRKSKKWQLLALENINGTNTGLWQFKNKFYSTCEYNDNWKEIKNSDISVTVSEAESFGQDFSIPQNDQQDNSNGMNIIEGSNKKDKLKGSNGADKIFGYKGADKIDGKECDHIIDSGLWKKGKYDVVKGGSGSDTFILKDGYRAYIKDFKIFEDKLDLSGISGDFSWEYWKKRTYICDSNDIEVARIKGSVDIDSADLIL